MGCWGHKSKIFLALVANNAQTLLPYVKSMAVRNMKVFFSLLYVQEENVKDVDRMYK